MKCPVCSKTLESNEIENGLNALVCSECRGKWISFDSYETWLKNHTYNAHESSVRSRDMTIPEFEIARLCPRCRRILVKYKVGKNIPFRIDRCTNCAGVWLDEDEWEILKSRNLHDDLSNIFTDHWQAEVAREETRATLDQIYESKFGSADYERMKEFKSLGGFP